MQKLEKWYRDKAKNLAGKVARLGQQLNENAELRDCAKSRFMLETLEKVNRESQS